MTDARATIDSIETRYLELFWDLQRRRWEFYANDAALDLTDLSTAFYSLSQAARQVQFENTARDRVLRQIMQRIRVDHHPEVSSLANRLADWSKFLPVPDTITPAWRRNLSEAMEPDVIRLLKKRNSLAKELGFGSYGHLVADSEGFNLDAMVSFAIDQRTQHLTAAAEATRRDGISVANWFDWLEHLAEGGAHNASDEAQKLTSELGQEDLSRAISWTVREQPIAGYDCAVSVPDDIRLLVRPVVSNDGLGTVFHELGHGLAHAANETTGIFRTWTSLADESMAVVMERIGVTLRFTPEARATAEPINQLEAARMATSFLFEVEVNADPSHAHALYRQWYEPLMEIEDPVVWASDSFRVDDPFYIHTYLVGQVVATATVDFLRDRYDNDHRSWGAWLRSHYYRKGRRCTLFDRITDLEEYCPEDVLTLEKR